MVPFHYEKINFYVQKLFYYRLKCLPKSGCGKIAHARLGLLSPQILDSSLQTDHVIGENEEELRASPDVEEIEISDSG